MTRAGDDPLVGMVLGGCRIEEILGRGGMGTVYRAHHHALDKPVALKLLAPHLAGDRDFVERFVHEARAAAKIDHPNVVHVLNVSAESEQYFIVMQFVEGESLEQILKRSGKLETVPATRIARDVASGLEALHGAGVIHRDIKPANILISRDRTVKITDFGLARNLKQQRGITVEGSFMGTPEFVSPEQILGGTVDARADLYSLGVTYYQMVSGVLPFVGKSPMEVATQNLRDEALPLVRRMPEVDPRVSAIAERLLKKEPAERYPDARALRLALEDVLGIVQGGMPTPRTERAPDPVSQAPTVPIPARGRIGGVPKPPEPARDDAPLEISAAPKKKVPLDPAQIVPREFVVPPPPPKPETSKLGSESRVLPPPRTSPETASRAASKPGPETRTRLGLPGPVRPMPPPPMPPKPVPVATGKVPRKSAIARPARNLLFWLLVPGGWALLLLCGLLGAPHRGDSFWEGLARPFVEFEGAWLERVGMFAGGLALLVAAFFQNRKEIGESHTAGPCVMLLAFAGLLFYAGGLAVPPGRAGIGAVVQGVAAIWPHSSNLVLAAVWGIVTGLGLGAPRGASTFWRVAGAAVVVVSLAVLAVYASMASGGSVEGLLDRLKRPVGAGIAGPVALALAGGGFALAFGNRRSKAMRASGFGLVALAATAAFLLGLFGGEADGSGVVDSLLALPEAWVEHGGLLTFGGLFGLWGACLLYNRFTIL